MQRGVLILSLVGIVAFASAFAFSFDVLRLSYGIACPILAGLVIRGTWRTMKDASRFVTNKELMDTLDDSYRKLEKELLALTTSR